jgi:hypothetical protein
LLAHDSSLPDKDFLAITRRVHKTLSKRFTPLGTEDEYAGVCLAYMYASVIPDPSLAVLDGAVIADGIRGVHPNTSAARANEIAELIKTVLAPSSTSLSLPVPPDDSEDSLLHVLVTADDMEFSRVRETECSTV